MTDERILANRSSRDVALAFAVALPAWALTLYPIVVRPVPHVPVQLAWLLFVGAGVFLPIALWEREGKARVVREAEGAVLEVERSGGRGRRRIDLSSLESVTADQNGGRVTVRWRPESGSTDELVLRCRDAGSFADAIRRAGAT